MSLSRSILFLIGRVCLGSPFLYEAIDKIIRWDVFMALLEESDVPYRGIILSIMIFLQCLGALSLLLGAQTKVGATILLAILVPATFYIYPFWHNSGKEREEKLLYFLSNLGYAGGLCYMVAMGGGKFSVDGESPPSSASGSENHNTAQKEGGESEEEFAYLED